MDFCPDKLCNVRNLHSRLPVLFCSDTEREMHQLQNKVHNLDFRPDKLCLCNLPPSFSFSGTLREYMKLPDRVRKLGF